MNKQKILIVDDEKGFSEVVRLSLEFTGKYEVKTENNSGNALSTALQYRPNLILLDVIMANKEGPDVATELKSDPLLKGVPIVFLTATVTPEEVDAEGGTIGGQAFIAKPSSLNVLLDSIEKNIMAT